MPHVEAPPVSSYVWWWEANFCGILRGNTNHFVPFCGTTGLEYQHHISCTEGQKQHAFTCVEKSHFLLWILCEIAMEIAAGQVGLPRKKWWFETWRRTVCWSPHGVHLKLTILRWVSNESRKQCPEWTLYFTAVWKQTKARNFRLLCYIVAWIAEQLIADSSYQDVILFG